MISLGKWCLTDPDTNTIYIPLEHQSLLTIEEESKKLLIEGVEQEIGQEKYKVFTFMADDIFENLCEELSKE